MKITYLGHSCFCLENQQGIKVITDPYTQVGYELPQGLTADVVTVSHGHFDHNYLPAIQGQYEVVSTEGKHSAKGITFEGMHTWHDPKQGALRGDNLLFKWEMDGVRICHFGDLGEEYSSEIAQWIENADVWLLPIGGKYTIDAKQAFAYVERCQPKAIVLMHYRPLDGALDIAKAEEFLQLANGYPITHIPTGEWSVSKTDLQDKQTKIIYMERRK